jgi:putative ABC transport system permease protein
MVTTILTSLNERRREMAILRSVGARPTTILGLLVVEGTLLTLAGVILGTLLLYISLYALRPVIDRDYGLDVNIGLPSTSDLTILAAIVLAGIVASVLPALRAYRLSVADGMMIRT